MTHCSWGSVVWKSRRMVGIATLRTEPSSPTMKIPVRTTASVIHRRGSTGGAGGVIAVVVGLVSVGFPPRVISV